MKTQKKMRINNQKLQMAQKVLQTLRFQHFWAVIFNVHVSLYTFIIRSSDGTANALDFQLITLLYATVDSDDYHYIISNDKGYDASVSMANRININNVMRFNTIFGAVKDYEKHLAEYEAEQEAENDTSTGTDAGTLSDGVVTSTVEIIPVVAELHISETTEFVQKLLEQDSELTLSQEKTGYYL